MRRLLATFTLCISFLCLTALPVPAQHDTVAQPDKQTQTVYITRTGKKYHRDGCQHLGASKIAISLKDAKAKGYTACKACHPSECRRHRSLAFLANKRVVTETALSYAEQAPSKSPFPIFVPI
jgi:hypothetical protein